jgi:hypothetical protein
MFAARFDACCDVCGGIRAGNVRDGAQDAKCVKCVKCVKRVKCA